MSNTNSAAPPQSDRRLWREAMRSVTPLRRRAAASSAPPPVTVEASPPNVPPLRHPPVDRFAGIDRANAERLKRGQHRIEARLDLHGMTQSEAYRAVAAFVHASGDSGLRCVLIITGRGLDPDGPGVLKSAVPRWLEQPGLRRQILAIAPAQPRHGGAGALYLLLRRRRREP
jgi:DNA-nicking Smr family endonuclease